MTLDEAITHTKLMIERGDKECSTKTWSGGGFKREAIQALLDNLTAASTYAIAPSQPAPVVVPSGWKMVPVEPTEEMELAGWIDGDDVTPRDIYRAMLSTAPQPDKESGLRNALNEVVTNGRWTEGEQCGEWAITKEVYETARDELDFPSSNSPQATEEVE